MDGRYTVNGTLPRELLALSADQLLWAKVTSRARCADSALDPDEWFPVSPGVDMARRQAADAIAVCATDIEILRHGLPAMIDGELPFNKGFTPGHEYMGTVVERGPGGSQQALVACADGGKPLDAASW